MSSPGTHEGRSVFPLRPLGAGEVLDAAVTTIRAYPRATLGPSAVLYGSMLALVAVAGASTAIAFSSDSPVAQGFAAIVAALGIFGAELASGVVQLGVVSVFSTLMAGVVARAVLGRPAPLRAVWRDTRNSFGWLLLYAVMLNFAFAVPLLLLLPVSILLGAFPTAGPYLYLAGVLLLGVVTTFFYAQVWLAPAAVVFERVHVIKGVARAWQVTAGGRWRATGIVALTLLICLLLWAAISAGLGSVVGLVIYLLSIAFTPTTLAVLSFVSTFVGALLIGAVATPFLSVVASVAYVDQRSRTEGLDLVVGEVRTAGRLHDLPVAATVIGPGTPFAGPAPTVRG